MSKRDLGIPLQHMLDHAEEAVAMAKDHSRADLDANRQLSLALTRLMEVVGEAANRVPIEIREEIKEIPWAGVVGLRNRLIHGYDEVDHDISVGGGYFRPATPCRSSEGSFKREWLVVASRPLPFLLSAVNSSSRPRGPTCLGLLATYFLFTSPEIHAPVSTITWHSRALAFSLSK